MSQQPKDEDMNTKTNRDRLIEACATDATAAPRDDLRSRLARASRPARRIALIPVD